MLLTLLGIALGFTTIDPMQERDPLAGIGIGTGIYIALVHIIALFVGGYAAARLSSSAWSSAAVLHGVAVWALVSLLSLFMAASAIGSMVTGTAALMSNITGGVTQAVQSAVPDNMNMPDLSQVVPDNLFGALPPEIQQSLEQRGLTPQEVQREATAIAQELVTEQERQRATDAITSTATAIIRNPGQADQRTEQLMNQLQNTLFSQQDRQQALQQLQNRLGIQPQEAQAMVDQWQQSLDAAAEQIRTGLGRAQEQAVQMAQQVTEAIASAAWWAFLLSLLGLAAAIGGAMVGRPEEHPTRA
ncbi:MAG: hypothetical protein WD382_04525 [Halofilum sp. (in: g-proteobacteria)]